MRLSPVFFVPLLVAFLGTSSPLWADNSPLKTGLDVKAVKKVDVEGVKIENFAGAVTIHSRGKGKTVGISLTGADALLKQVIVQEDKGTLHIAFEKGAPVLKDVSALSLTLEMPATLPLDLTLVGGKAVVGPRETPETKVNLIGFGDIKVASLRSLESTITGSGEIEVMEIKGDANLHVRGDGKFTLHKGEIPHLNARMEGTGEMDVWADVKDADLKSEGAGVIRLATVQGRLSQFMNGAGVIRIAKIAGSLENKGSGSGHLAMNKDPHPKKGK